MNRLVLIVLFLLIMVSCTKDIVPIGETYPFDKGSLGKLNLQVIGWSEDNAYHAVRVYYKLDKFTGSCGETPNCKGYITHEGKRFQGGLKIYLFHRAKLIEKFHIYNNPVSCPMTCQFFPENCTPISEARKNLNLAKASLKKYGIDLKIKGTTLQKKENTVFLDKNNLLHISLKAKTQHFPDGDFATVKYTYTIFHKEGDDKRLLFSQDENGSYNPDWGQAPAIELLKAVSSPNNKIIFIYCTRTATRLNATPFVLTTLYHENGSLKSIHDTSVDLFSAIEKNDIKKIRKLLKSGINLNDHFNFYGNTPLSAALAITNYKIAKLLIDKGANVNKKTRTGGIPLLSVRDNNYNLIQLLIENGADRNIIIEGRGAKLIDILFHNLFREKDIKLAKYLIQKGADINSVISTGETSLHHSVKWNQPEMVQFLLENNAKINIQDKEGATPLFNAAKRSHLQFIELLLQKKADINIKTNKGETPLHAICTSNYSSRDKFKIIQKLAEHGADINAQDDNGNTPLDLVNKNIIKRQYKEIADYMISINAVSGNSSK